MNVYSEAVENKAHAISGVIHVNRSYDKHTPHTRIRNDTSLAMLLRADSFWISADIWKAIVTSSQSLPLDFIYTEDMAPVSYGWLWLEEPWKLPGGQLHTRQHPENEFWPAAHAIAWGQGIAADTGRSMLAVETYHRGVSGAILPLYYTVAHPALSIGEEEERRRLELESKNRAGDDEPLHALMRVTLSLFLWLKQTICVSRTIPLERHARKRLERAEMVKALNIITLRRAQREPSHGNGEPVEWSCRWLVSGHWRQQYHPSTGKREPVYILPYVKGPEDKPLKAPTPTVFAVTR